MSKDWVIRDIRIGNVVVPPPTDEDRRREEESAWKHDPVGEETLASLRAVLERTPL